jgi:hypothetical protein
MFVAFAGVQWDGMFLGRAEGVDTTCFSKRKEEEDSELVIQGGFHSQNDCFAHSLSALKETSMISIEKLRFLPRLSFSTSNPLCLRSLFRLTTVA